MLDPKVDVVFKLLLARPDNAPLLSSMIQAVLDLPEPPAEVTVLNPEVPRDLAEHKAIALDLHVRCADGLLIDVEMETHPRPVLAERATFYLASLYASQLVRGQDYAELRPAKSILWLDGPHRSLGRRFHSTFSLREDELQTRLTAHFELHFLCLPELGRDPRPVRPSLARWARFLLAPDERSLHALAMEDATMKKAVGALEGLSRDPEVRSLVDTVARDRFFRRYELSVERREGREEGRKEGLREVAQKLLAEGMTVDHVARLTGLASEVVQALATEVR